MNAETRERRKPDEIGRAWLSQPDPVGAWLDVLMGLVRLAPAEKRAIRDELDSHLRDRVRDLMLNGLREPEATRDAIAELGDAAELAARYARASRAPARRRFAMNLGLFGVAGAALITSMVALNGGGQPAGMSVYPGLPARETQAIAVGDVREENISVQVLLKQVAKAAGKRLVVDWNSLAACGIEPVTEVSVDVPGADLAAVLAAIGEATMSQGEAAPGSTPAYRVTGDELRVGSATSFDLAERVIATVDISEVLARDIEVEELTNLVTTFIEPEQWVDNGGEVSALSVVGGKLFVKAPPRVIEGVRWIVGELSSEAKAERGRRNDDSDDDMMEQALRGRPASQELVIRLEQTNAESMREIVGRALNIAPSMRQSPVSRVLGIDRSENTLMVRATEPEIEWIERLVSELEIEGPLPDTPVSEDRTFRLRHANAADVRAFLGEALDVNPVLKECPVARVMEVDASENLLRVVATPAHVDAIERIVLALDQ